MPIFPVRIHAIGSLEGPMTLPKFFFKYTNTLPRPVALAIAQKGDINFDLMSLEAAERPAPFRLDERIAKVITEKALGKAYPEVEIDFVGEPPKQAGSRRRKTRKTRKSTRRRRMTRRR